MSTRRWATLAGAFLVIGAYPALAQDASSQIRKEIGRLQQRLKDKPASASGFAGLADTIGGDLKSSAAALDAGRLYLSLETLRRASDLLSGLETVAQKSADVEKGGLAAYQAVWDAENRDLTALDREMAAQPWDHAPAAVRALAETAQVQAKPLLEGGLGFANATAPKDGVFYLGQAAGEAQFARFCATLRFPPGTVPRPRRSLAPELRNLQEKTNAAFVPPRSIDLHSRFIALNSTLKLAQELESAKLYDGALYEYLDAIRHFAMLDAAPADAAAPSGFEADLARARDRLAAAPGDQSIARAFLERAETAASPEEMRSARVIVDRVLPAYFAALQPAQASPLPPGKLIDITLVRWPYT
ncbi:MAG TPA: hypothetical protein VMI94_04025 [Bryobacteraceae bacterium]|nr:hypothetical protein [Bryobacteraceae bacterium]